MTAAALLPTLSALCAVLTQCACDVPGPPGPSGVTGSSNCISNPCLNGGTFVDRGRSRRYRCDCKTSYSGNRCQYRRDSKIVANGVNLRDRDGETTSDPYVEVVAYDRSGGSKRLTTPVERNDVNPEWNRWLTFGVGDWNRFTVHVLDSDDNADDPLSSTKTCLLSSFTRQHLVQLNAFRGHVSFSYFFVHP